MLNNQDFKIICVDDDELTTDHYQDIISELGYEVITFTKPADVIKHLKLDSKKVCMIVSDYSMPDMDGFELRKELLTDFHQIPFILVTSFFTKEMAFQGMNYQISSFVDKADETAMLEAIEQYSESRKRMIEDDLEMLQGFLDETMPMIEDIETCILQLEENVDDTEAIDTYFRLLHTIKGTAACLGILDMANYTHKYEDFVSLLKAKSLQVDASVINVLLKGLDVLKSMLYALEADTNEEFNVDELVKIFEFLNLESVEVEKTDAKVDDKVVDGKKDEGKKKEFVKVSMDLLDEFMELNGELTVIRNTLSNSVKSIEKKLFGDKDVEVLVESLGEMHKTCSLLQGQISEFRKVNIGTIYRPLKRVVRDASKGLGKNVHFESEGDDLRVDNTIGKILSGSLVHLVRNSIDHGIEMPDEREAIGKDAQGHLSISAEEIGEIFRVTIQDDGKGINPEIVKNKAIEKGLYTEQQLEMMPESRLLSIIFEAGFSTAQQVSDLSGRGVGMDMVKSSVTNAKGKIHIDSKVGEGTKFTLDIPIPKSVLIVNTLLVKSAGQTFVFSLDDIHEIDRVPCEDVDDKIFYINGSLFMNHLGKHIPVLNLSDVLNLNKSEKKAADGAMNIIVLRVENFKYGVIVDSILDFEEAVVKPLGIHLKHLEVYAGASLIGDGGVALLIDALGLGNLAELSIDEISEEHYANEAAIDPHLNSVEYMFFRRGDTAMAIELDRVDRLESFEYKNIQMSGSIQVLKYRNTTLPLFFPELLLDAIDENIEKVDDELFNSIIINHGEQRIGLVVDVVEDIGRVSGEIDTLTSNNRGIKGTIFFEGKTISVLDFSYLVSNSGLINIASKQKIENTHDSIEEVESESEQINLSA